MADGTTRPDPDLGSHPSGYLMFEWRRASAVGGATLCVGLGAHDVEEIGKLLREAVSIPTDPRPRLLADSPRCRQIAVAAGYSGRHVSVVELYGFYAVAFGDEIRMLDAQLRLVPQQATKRQ
jgi:hypothetical protein